MKQILIAMALILGLAGLSACTSERYGAGVDRATPRVKVKDLFLDRSVLGRSVTIEGRISSQCGSNGCWFVLQDDTGQVFINLAPNNMTLPPRMNKSARVTGTVAVVQDQLQVFAQGVEVR